MKPNTHTTSQNPNHIYTWEVIFNQWIEMHLFIEFTYTIRPDDLKIKEIYVNNDRLIACLSEEEMFFAMLIAGVGTSIRKING